MALLVLAYPELAENDYELIQKFRKENDELFYQAVEPHFTFVFPVFDFKKKEFIKEIRTQSKSFTKINFIIRCSTINKDSFGEYYHAFLVPDEGYSNIVKLHDKLYSNELLENLRLDIDFVPHIGVGNNLSASKCKLMVDSWNVKQFEIKGKIKELHIVDYDIEKNTQKNLEVISLL